MIDIRQSDRYAKYLRNISWKVDVINHTKVFTRKISFLGTFLKLQRPENLEVKRIEKFAKKNKVFKIIVEPKNTMDAKHLLSLGYKQSNKPYLPSKTLHLDLTKTKEQLLKKMKKDARATLKIKKSTSLVAQNTADIEIFRKAWRGLVGFKRHVPSIKQLKALRSSFKGDSLFISSFDINRKKIIAGAIFLKTNNVAYYWQAFTGKEGRKSKAQYNIVWDGILWAKANGIKVFDFEGIYDSRFPDKTWAGFTHFKRSFGGEEVEYPGVFIKKV